MMNGAVGLWLDRPFCVGNKGSVEVTDLSLERGML